MKRLKEIMRSSLIIEFGGVVISSIGLAGLVGLVFRGLGLNDTSWSDGMPKMAESTAISLIICGVMIILLVIRSRNFTSINKK